MKEAQLNVQHSEKNLWSQSKKNLLGEHKNMHLHLAPHKILVVDVN
jgi:hypothetical protein